MCPIYEYSCPAHGLFERFQPMSSSPISQCPDCDLMCDRLISKPSIIVKEKKRLRYGSNSPGRYISHEETGGVGILIPSFGMMEKEEIDDIASAAIEEEKAAVKRKARDSMTKRKLSSLVALAHRTKKGKRADAIKEVLKQKERQI